MVSQLASVIQNLNEKHIAEQALKLNTEIFNQKKSRVKEIKTLEANLKKEAFQILQTKELRDQVIREMRKET